MDVAGAVLSQAFIAILAYTNRPTLSRDKLSWAAVGTACSVAWRLGSLCFSPPRHQARVAQALLPVFGHGRHRQAANVGQTLFGPTNPFIVLAQTADNDAGECAPRGGGKCRARRLTIRLYWMLRWSRLRRDRTSDWAPGLLARRGGGRTVNRGTRWTGSHR